MSKFKNKIAVSGSLVLKKAFIEELDKLGYKRNNSCSGTDSKYIQINQYGGSGVYSCHSNAEHESSSDPTIYTLPLQWNEALKAASVKQEEEYKKGEYIIMTRAGGWSYDPVNNGCIAIITEVRQATMYGCEVTKLSGTILNPKTDSYVNFSLVPVHIATQPHYHNIIRKASHEEVHNYKKNLGIKKIGNYDVVIFDDSVTIGCAKLSKGTLQELVTLYSKDQDFKVKLRDMTITKETIDNILKQMK